MLHWIVVVSGQLWCPSPCCSNSNSSRNMRIYSKSRLWISDFKLPNHAVNRGSCVFLSALAWRTTAHTCICSSFGSHFRTPNVSGNDLHSIRIFWPTNPWWYSRSGHSSFLILWLMDFEFCVKLPGDGGLRNTITQQIAFRFSKVLLLCTKRFL